MKKAMALAFMLIFMAGCALTTERIDITYTPQVGTPTLSEAKNIVLSVQVNDQRKDRSDKVSCKKNAFGMEMAPILANEGVTTTARRAMEIELKSRGFAMGSDYVVLIVSDMLRFYSDYRVGFFSSDAVAELNMNVTVSKKNGDIIYTRSISAMGLEAKIQLMTGNNARLALNQALESGMKILFNDQDFLTALLKSNN